MMHRTSFIAFGVPLVILGLAGFSLLSAEKVRYSNATKTNALDNLPALAAEEKGFWKREGLEVEWFVFDSGGAQGQAIAAGGVDSGIWDAGSLIPGVAKGVPALMVADMKADYNFFFWVRPESSLREPKDLQGKAIGISRRGSYSYAMGKVALKALGMEKDVRLVATGGVTSSIAALKAGTVDGIILSNLTMAVPKFRRDAREFINIRNYLPKDWIGLTIYAHKEFAKKSPEALKRLIRAVFNASHFAMENPAWAIAKMKELAGYPEEVAQWVHKSVIRYGDDWKIDRASVQAVSNFLIEYGFMAKEEAPGPELIFTNQHIDLPGKN